MRIAASGAAASLVLAMASVLALATPAPASTGSCDGVWVVVDARAAGGSLSTRCAPGDPSSGLAALQQAGFSYTFTPRIPGFVCTIDARPDPCNGAPTDAYWSYWYAEAGGSWTYATAGAGSRDPSPGTVEGWRFGDGSTPPGTAPPANAPEPEPEPPAPPRDADAMAAGGGSADSSDRSDGRAASQRTAADRSGDGTSGEEATDRDATTTDGSPDRSSPAVDETDGDTAAPAGEGADEEAPSGPTWEPAPVETGEWANPPPTDAPTSAPSAALPPEASATREADTPPADDEEMALATRQSAPAPAAPVGAVLAVGLLGGLGALTWRQRVQRSGPRA